MTRRSSKAHSLAGFRVGGYAVAPEAIARDRNTSNDACPLARPSQAAALTTLQHPDQIRDRVSQLKARTRELMADLGRPGLRCCLTETYFFLADVSPFEGVEFARGLRERRILVKPIEGGHLSRGYVRMTTSTPENNRRVVQAVGEVIDRLNRLSDP